MSFAHFKQAQAKEYGGFAHALEEMEQGHKQSHWIWYIFPQIAGLGRSPMAQTYALADADEATAYLRDPELRERLLTITRAVAAQIERGMPLGILMGAHIDVLKLVSSMTLFESVASELASRSDDALGEDARELAGLCTQILDATSELGFPRCQHTLAALSS